MGEDETAIMVMLGLFALIRWVIFYVNLGRGAGPRVARGAKAPVALAPLAAAAVLLGILTQFASWDVRGSGTYLFFYMVLGAGWCALVTVIPAWLGLGYRDDVAERGNMAAGLAIGGAILGATLPFIGANIGDGPGWWVVFYTGGVALGVFVACWIVLELVTGVSETITVDRDVSAGLRVGALFVANGVILGRAAAGNWYGSDQAVRQVLQIGTAAVVLTVVAIVVERIMRPTPEHARPPLVAGFLPALVYAVASAAWLSLAGWWT